MDLKLRTLFIIDEHEYNPVPKNFLKKIFNLFMTQRYSMPVYLRLTEYFYLKYKSTNNRFYYILSTYFKRKNEIVNQFEHMYEHNIAYGTVFHHTGVTLNSNVIIEKNCQLFKNVILGMKDGKCCKIGENSMIFSNSILLGVNIGRNCIVGAGSVVTKDLPDFSVAVGNPARIIGSTLNEDMKKYLVWENN